MLAVRDDFEMCVFERSFDHLCYFWLLPFLSKEIPFKMFGDFWVDEFLCRTDRCIEMLILFVLNSFLQTDITVLVFCSKVQSYCLVYSSWSPDTWPASSWPRTRGSFWLPNALRRWFSFFFSFVLYHWQSRYFFFTISFIVERGPTRTVRVHGSGCRCHGTCAFPRRRPRLVAAEALHCHGG